ncbi:MAG: hypothetical protein ACYSUT_09745 [Planctomycetota bacterium]|jgi:hypothetical protein
MKKSGLQKQISSIFNEAPIPVGEVDAAELPSEPVAEPTSAPVQAPAPSVEIPVAKPSMPSLSQRMAGADEQTGFEAVTEAVHTPAVPTMRPRPLKRTNATEQKPKSASLSAQFKKVAGGSGKGMDPKQKKMTIMVGVLSVVFGLVLFISLGGLGGASVQAADNTNTENETTTVKNDVEPLQWHTPAPLPEQLRDPMKPAPKKVVRNAGQTATAGGGVSGLVVKGIVFSKTNPTAIINEKIVAQGETVNGVSIVKIGREEVEFEQNGNRWTQTVQR